MDNELMGKLGWSKELVDSFNAIRNIIDESPLVKEPYDIVGSYKREGLDSSSIIISNSLPVGHNYISFVNEESQETWV